MLRNGVISGELVVQKPGLLREDIGSVLWAGFPRDLRHVDKHGLREGACVDS